MSDILSRSQCPKCLEKGSDNSKNNLINFANGSKHCFNCGFHSNSIEETNTGFKPKRPLLPVVESNPIPHRGIKLPTVEKYGVFRTTLDNQDVTVIPLGKDVQKVIRDDKSIHIRGDSGLAQPMGSSSFKSKNLPLVITEGEYDALSVSQVVGDSYNVTSLVNGSNSVVQFIDNYRDLLVSASQIILFFDSDNAGQKAVEEFINKWGYSKVYCIESNPVKDANDLLMSNQDHLIKSLIRCAKSSRMPGVNCIADMDLSVLDEVQPPAIPSQYTALDYYLGGGFRRGELTMMAGGSGLGKSTFCTNLVYNLIMSQPGIKIADIKLEKRQSKNIKSYIAMYFNMSYKRICEQPDLISLEHRNEFKHVFGNLYTNEHFGSLTSSSLLNLLNYYAVDCGVDFIILDHISIAISGTASSREGERKDIDVLVTKIRELINKTNVSIICVSQLKNPESEGGYASKWEEGKRVSRSHLRGSGSLQHLADNIISVEGNLYGEDKEDRLIRLIKTREGDEQEVECDIFNIDKYTQKAILKIKGV